MKKLLLIALLSLVWTLGLGIVTANGQTAYGISIIQTDGNTRMIDGYSGTWLDYYAGIYYDPEVHGELIKYEDVIDEGRMVGYADIIPAEVLLHSADYQGGQMYCTFSEHYVWAYYYYVPNNWWFDPFQYSYFSGNGNGPWPGFPFTYNYVPPRRYLLGRTDVCVIAPHPPPPATPTPFPPTPTPPSTPTPTPTVTPTPVPCDEGSLSPQCQPTVSVYLSTNPLRPKGTTGGANTSQVTTCLTGVSEPGNKQVQLQLLNDSFGSQIDGGHKEDYHSGIRPLGTLGKKTGTTNGNGCFVTTYSPSHVNGKFKLKSTILGASGTTDIKVYVPGFFRLGTGENYKLIGESLAHPDNHWGVSLQVGALPLIADDYKNQYYLGAIPEEKKLAYNDMSLEWGGKFDLKKAWAAAGAHAEHREGINCDVRSNNVDQKRRATLKQIFRTRGSTNTNDETNTAAPHWHLRFEAGILQSGISEMVDGIEQNPTGFTEVNPGEQTPASFVGVAFWSILDREHTQEEWEEWYPQIQAAKAQGPNELMQTTIMFEKAFFSSSEYIARHRTNEEFISDVFNAHLNRDPTALETSYWVDYLGGLPPSLTQQKKRIRLIDQIEARPVFADAIAGMVDDVVIPAP